MIQVNKLSIIIALIIALSACQPKKSVNTFVDDQSLINTINNGTRNNYPDYFKTLHHVILDLAGKNYVLDGYIQVDRRLNKVSVNAQNDLGGSIFKIDFIKNSSPTITMPFKVFEEKWLKNGVVKDLEHLYLSTPFPSPRLTINNNLFTLIQKSESGVVEKRIFERMHRENWYRLKSYIRVNSGKTIYRIDYKYKKYSNINLPYLISIDNKKMHYKLIVNALYFINKK